MHSKRRRFWIATSLVVALALCALLATVISRTAGGPKRIQPSPRSELPVPSGSVGTIEQPPEEGTGENVVYLSDLTWQSATTGWVAAANDDLPSLDSSFRGGPLVIEGVSFAKGLGVYPLSEIVYALDGQYLAFSAAIGLNDLALGVEEDSSSAVVFAVYADGALAYDSGIIRRGQLPAPVELPIAGVRQLRLVVSQAGPPSTYNTADWADARFVRGTTPIDEVVAAAVLDPLRGQLASQDELRREDRDALTMLTSREAHDIAALPPTLPNAGASVAFFPDRKVLVLSNDVLALSYGFGGEEHGLLTVFHKGTGRLVLYQSDASVLTAPNQRLSLHYDTAPSGEGSFATSDYQDAAFGHGKRLDISLTSRDGQIGITFSLTLFDGSPYYLQQISLKTTTSWPGTLRIAHFESLGPSNLVLGEQLHYLTDVSRLRSADVPDDGLERSETIDPGKPVYLTSSPSDLGLLFVTLDESAGPIEFSIQVDPGHVRGRLGLFTGAARAEARQSPSSAVGPRLYVEVTGDGASRHAFQNFRRFMARLYPPLALPVWVRYQWLSWYTYYMDINEDRIRREIDYIAENLGDLGPWHIIVDAGWYVAEGRPEADWRSIDRDKFPAGLRALVDYAHSRNVKVVLYFSAPYVDSRSQPGDWLGLRGLIQAHPDWLIPIGEDETHQSFVYDLENPALRGYLQEVMRDYFVAYDVDGIKIDGLGNAEGAVLTSGERDAFGLVEKVRQPALDIYRLVHDEATSLKPDAYIESGWLTPLFANPLAHAFRYGDEAMAFSSRYPWTGFVEHVDYAIAQQSLWGQRANMGAVSADPNQSPLNEQWIAASIALGAQSVLSFDLPVMSDETLSRYRSLLAHYRPFAGSTFYGNTSGVDSFATAHDGLTYLGILNRGEESRRVTLPLADYGLSPELAYRLYDVSSERFGLTQGQLSVNLEPRSFRLFLLRRDPGVIWTNSSYALTDGTAHGLALTVDGPRQLHGFTKLYTPAPTAVYLDGIALSAGPVASEGTYAYDATTGILEFRYSHAREHRIEISY